MHRLRKQTDQPAYAGTPCAAEMHASKTRQMQSQIGATAAVNQCWRRMKHPSIRRLFDYWNERRGARLLPRREDIEAEAIRCALVDTFIFLLRAYRRPSNSCRRHACALYSVVKSRERLSCMCSRPMRGEVSNLISVISRTGSRRLLEVRAAIFRPARSVSSSSCCPSAFTGADSSPSRRPGAAISPWRRVRAGSRTLRSGSYRFIGGLCSAVSSLAMAERRSDRRFVVYEGGQR